MEAQKAFDSIIAIYGNNPGVSIGKMFGSPGLKVNNKVFALLVKNQLVVKLEKERVDSLVAEGKGQYFDPGHGRLMKQWITIPMTFQAEWPNLAEEARKYLAS